MREGRNSVGQGGREGERVKQKEGGGRSLLTPVASKEKRALLTPPPGSTHLPAAEKGGRVCGHTRHRGHRRQGKKSGPSRQGPCGRGEDADNRESRHAFEVGRNAGAGGRGGGGLAHDQLLYASLMLSRWRGWVGFARKWPPRLSGRGESREQAQSAGASKRYLSFSF